MKALALDHFGKRSISFSFPKEQEQGWIEKLATVGIEVESRSYGG